MKALAFHPSAKLAWAMANGEAWRARSEQIEPLHLYLAILKILDDVQSPEAEGIQFSVPGFTPMEDVQADAQRTLGLSSTELTRLRRRVAQASEEAGDHGYQERLHRSEACRAVFQSGGELALEQRAEALDLGHLLRALLDLHPPDIVAFLPGGTQGKPALAWETRVNEFANKYKLSRITVVFTDMEGSTAIKRRLGDLESARVFRAHDNLLREQLRASEGGREIKTIGDAFLLAFAEETEAVIFALRVQAALRRDPRLSQVPVRVRAGIFAGPILSMVGEPSGMSDPVFGITIDTASRVAALASANQILMDRGVFEIASKSLASQAPTGLETLEWRPHGAFRLKGIDEPVEIFEVGEAGKGAFTLPRDSDKAAAIKPVPPAAKRTRPPMAGLGRDLTALAEEGRLAPVVGRQREIRALARCLQRTTKRNALILGPAGVGKTAVVEGLAQWASGPEAPEALRGLRIVELRLSDLVAGTKYRGDLEKRLKELLDEAARDPGLVLFLDEIHMAVGRSGEGPASVANFLKPALMGDDLRLVGATTLEEFDQFLKDDAAFTRRFQILRVEEPGREESLAICQAWARRIESLQDLTFEEAAIAAAVDWTARLLPKAALPDKAIDLLENAAARVKLPSGLESAAPLAKDPLRVRLEDVRRTFEEQFGLKVSAAEALPVRRAMEALARDLIGQDKALADIREALEASAAGPERGAPLVVLLFVGPTGTGKTFAAETLARAMELPLGRFNLSEFRGDHEISKLIGAPPGFIGHERPGALFRFTNLHPRGLILLDEVDKAPIEFQDYFLQIFDKGEALDSKGRLVSFRNHAFVLACNPPDGAGKAHDIGFGGNGGEHGSLDKLDKFFRREFLARMDRVVAFEPFGETAYLALFEAWIRAQAELLGHPVAVHPSLPRRALAEFSDAEDGARGFFRFLDRELGARARAAAADGSRLMKWD